MKTKDIELKPSEYEINPNKSTNSISDGTITTASTTPASSPDSDSSDIFMIENPLHQSRRVNLLASFNEVATPQINSMADRIRPTFEIHLSPEEKITHSIVHDINWSFLTPIGLQQYDYELKKITVVLSVEELQNLGLGEFVEESRHVRFDEETHLTYNELVEAKKKTTINDRLTLEQWKNLEIALIKSPYGRTVIGYSINEEVYLKFWGHIFQLYYQSLKHLGYPARDYQYPPRKDDAEKLMLDFFQKNVVKNVGLSAQLAAYSFLSVQSVLVIISLQNHTTVNASEIFVKYANYFASASALVFLCTFLFLNSNYFSNQFSTNTTLKLFFVLQEFVNNINRTINYLDFFEWFPKQTANQLILACSFPILVASIYFGLNKKDKTIANSYINIQKHTNLRFFYNILNWASYDQNLMLLSSRFLINLKFFFDNDDATIINEYNEINKKLFYILFLSCLAPHIMRHQYADVNLRFFSKYITNITNGLAYSLFDSLAFMGIYTLISISIFNKTTTTPKDYVDNSLYFTFISLFYFYSLHARYVNVNNIPEFSYRTMPNSNKLNYCQKIKSFLTFSTINKEITNEPENKVQARLN